MVRRRHPPGISDWIVDNSKMLVAIAAAVATFYFTVKFTLDKHEAQFAEVARTFEKFNKTLENNYSDYAKAQKEDALTRDKMREQFMNLFTQLSTSSVATGEQVKSISKQLDGVTTKIDSIQSGQQVIQRQGVKVR